MQFFFIKTSSNRFTVQVTNKISPWNCIFDFTNDKTSSDQLGVYLLVVLLKLPNRSITQNLYYYGIKTRVEFNGSCLKQDSVTFNHGKLVNIYIVYER